MTDLSAADEIWLKRINDAHASGLADYAWCRKNGYAASTYYYHLKRLRAMACDVREQKGQSPAEEHEIVRFDLEDGSQSIVPEEPRKAEEAQTFSCVPESEASGCAASIHYGGFRIDLQNSAGEDFILRIVRALRQSC